MRISGDVKKNAPVSRGKKAEGGSVRAPRRFAQHSEFRADARSNFRVLGNTSPALGTSSGRCLRSGAWRSGPRSSPLGRAAARCAHQRADREAERRRRFYAEL